MSGRKDIIQPFHNITDGDMSDDIVSEPTNVQYIDRITVQLIYTGTPVGSFYVETSLNYTPPITGAVDNATWSALRLSPAPVASGTADDILIDITQTATPWLRIRYVSTSGTGTLNSYVSGKMS